MELQYEHNNIISYSDSTSLQSDTPQQYRGTLSRLLFGSQNWTPS